MVPVARIVRDRDGVSGRSPLPTRRATLAAAFERSGVGLHTGKRSTVQVAPAAPGKGIVFRRHRRGGVTEVPALWPNRRSRPLCTALQVDEGPLVRTVEHLLAALSAAAIDDALIDIDGEEVPILDGSAAPWVADIAAAGRVESCRPRVYLKVRQRVRREASGGRKQTIEPAERFALKVSITLSHFGVLTWAGAVDAESFARELAPSRSFGRLKWALPGKILGLLPFREPVLRGAGPENTAALIGADAVGGLRMPDEPVRHRALDMVGDFALAGAPILGRIVASRPGHEHNCALLQRFMCEDGAYERVTLDEAGRLVPA